MHEMKTAVTLNWLKRDLPRGSPVVEPGTGRRGILRRDRAVRVTVLWDDCDHDQFAMRANVALDLATPVDGIDGADVAVAMLCADTGLAQGFGLRWEANHGDGIGWINIYGKGGCDTVQAKTDRTDSREILAAVLVASQKVKP